MKEWIEIAVGIASIVALVGSFVLAWLIAVRYRIPQLEQRVKALEDVNTGEIRTLVHKHELYNTDGRPIYMHRADCLQERTECNGTVCAEIEEVKQKLDGMEKSRAEARIEMISFMMAVTSKLKINFEIPKK